MFAQFLQDTGVLKVIFIIYKSPQMHPVTSGEMPENIVGTHLVPLVGGIRYAMHKIKQVPHLRPPIPDSLRYVDR